jgi:hypothetical protein
MNVHLLPSLHEAIPGLAQRFAMQDISALTPYLPLMSTKIDDQRPLAP